MYDKLHYKTCGYTVAIILLIIIILLALYKFSGFESGTPDTTTHPALPTQYASGKPFIFAGYNEIYDMIITVELLEQLNQQLKSINKSPLTFDQIPRLLIYIYDDDQATINIIPSKLKKSAYLLQFYQSLTETSPDDMQRDQSTDPATSITAEDFYKLEMMFKKHTITALSIDQDKYLSIIRKYIKYIIELHPEAMYNLALTSKEYTLLDINNDSVNKLILDNSMPSLMMNKRYRALMDNDTPPETTFTNTLFSSYKQVHIIFSPDMRDYYFEESRSQLEATIKAYLFNNPELGININMARILLFKMNPANNYEANIFFNLKESKSPDELTNKELYAKYSNIFMPNLAPEKIAKYTKLMDADPGLKATFKPDMEFYVLYNGFQVTRLLLKNRERDL